mmetsp:Transcript_11912/g.23492  ORF Transcript_11912/g.23492 Transcript_11912/m.23492 type:complete len:107 (+) Transcript_11912:40-360(+)
MFARTFTRIVRNKTAVRQMGGHAPAAPKEGFEGAVRKLIPHDHHFALAVIGFYFSLFAISKMLPSKKKVETVAAPVVASTGDIPSVESPEFGEWISAPGNIEKMLA